MLTKPLHSQGRAGAATHPWQGAWRGNVTVQMVSCNVPRPTIRWRAAMCKILHNNWLIINKIFSFIRFSDGTHKPWMSFKEWERGREKWIWGRTCRWANPWMEGCILTHRDLQLYCCLNVPTYFRDLIFLIVFLITTGNQMQYLVVDSI